MEAVRGRRICTARPDDDETLASNWWLLVACAALTIVFHSLLASYGLGLADEGFLWYGAQRVALGEAPLADFQSYEPGRYYLAAAGMLAGNGLGIHHVRVVNALLLVLTTLLLLQRCCIGTARTSWRSLIVVWIALTCWMIPDFKAADFFACGIISFAATRLGLHADPKRWFSFGIAVGLAGVVGRNHLLYGVVSGALLFAIQIALDPRSRDVARLCRSGVAGIAGAIVGISPMIALFVLKPRTWIEFVAGSRRILASGTNIPLPLPRPWWFRDLSHPLVWANLTSTALAFWFAPIVLAAIAIVTLKRARRDHVLPPSLALAVVGLPYLHYAFSRADVVHLSLGGLPLLAALLRSMLDQRMRTEWVGLIAVGCLITMYPQQRFRSWSTRNLLTDVMVQGERLHIDSATAKQVLLLKHVAQCTLDSGQTLLATPHWPGAYAVLGKRSPGWEIYALFARDREFQEREIARWRESAPTVALVAESTIDGDASSAFRLTHALQYEYIEKNYVQVPVVGVDGVRFFVVAAQRGKIEGLAGCMSQGNPP